MAIPFLKYFQRGKPEKQAKAAPVAPPPPVEKPSSERMSKTVLPNATRTIARTASEFEPARSSQSFATGAQAPAPASPRTISFAAQTRDLPPAVALALEPRVERVISLQLSDLIEHIPAGLVQNVSTVDRSERILLKAAEVEKGMANGRPTVSLASIHQQVPHLFVREIPASDTTQVALPFSKVLDEFTNLQVRGDQVRQAAVPQVETPFLKVTLEDNERFGTTTEMLETGDLPPVRVEPPTAQAFAKAEPEPAGAVPKSPAPSSSSDPAEKPAPPRTRIPFSLSPNGTDAPNPESVPASDGPSVPKGEPVASAAPPMRVPFRIVPPATAADEEKPAPEPWLTAETLNPAPLKAMPAPAAAPEVKIRLGLKLILQSLPPFQLTGDPNSVPDDVRVELPFSIVEPQLANGRISITPAVLANAIPQSLRGLVDASSAGDVLLPLQEVLKNLPSTSLRMRDDQVEQEVGANFATPFSAKAEEDAKRFNTASAPLPKPTISLEPEPEPAPEAVADIPEVNSEPATTDTPLRNPLQVALDTDDKLDAKQVVAHVNRMAGVKGSAIMFADGLSLAGSLPAEYETEALCAMAPSLLQRIENNLVETKLGPLRGTTLACAKGAVTFFMHDNLCLAAMHSNGEISAEVREKLGRVVHELSRKYSHPV